MKLELSLGTNRNHWRETYRFVDSSGLKHMSLITCNEDLDEGQVFLPCTGQWVDIHNFEKSSDFVTCLGCSQFCVRDGNISIWVPMCER